MVRTLKIGLLTLALGWATGVAAETLLVYTAVEPEWLSAIAMEGLRKAGVLEPYRPQGADAINPKMHAADWSWFGMNAWGGSICVNTDLLKKKGQPVPASWADLTKPIYKNQIVMPSPLASSTGYMFFWGWIQGFGALKTMRVRSNHAQR